MTRELELVVMSLPPSIHVVSHPLVQHKLTKMRDKETSSTNFRRLLREIGLLLGYDATRDLPLVETHIETPIAGDGSAAARRQEAGDRADPARRPRARRGHARSRAARPAWAMSASIAIRARCRRSSTTSRSRGDITDRDVIVCDPMLATAHSAIAAVDRLKETGAKRIKLICILAAEPGARAFAEVHPDVPVFTAAVDAKLNDHGYIVPGLGDAGDRLFGTK